jgi:hypothetical protein
MEMYSNEFVLLAHPTFGALAIMAAVWVFVETLNVGPDNVARLRKASYVSAALIWLTFLVGGYWYVTQYGVDKAVIKAGPWPFAHGFFMETKEHVFLMLLLLATLLPIVASSDLVKSAGSRKIVMWVAALVVLIGFALEGSGALISMGTKVGLMAQAL